MGLKTLSDPRMENLIFLQRMDSEQKVYLHNLISRPGILGSKEDMWMRAKSWGRVNNFHCFISWMRSWYRFLKDFTETMRPGFYYQKQFFFINFHLCERDSQDLLYEASLSLASSSKNFCFSSPDRRHNETWDRYVHSNNRKWY